MPYSFSRVLVWDNSAGVVRLARNVDVRVLDPTTGLTAPGLAVDGQPVQVVRSDHTGRVDFTADIGTVQIVPPAGIPVEQTSPDMLAEASQAAARAEAAEASAAASAALVGAPAKAAMDAAMGGDVAGLVPKVTGKADKTYIDAGLAAKADKTYVDTGLAAKASTTAVTQQFAQQLATTATVDFGTFGTPAFTYQVIRVKSRGLPGVVRKRFANNYETAGTKNANFKPNPRETLDSMYRGTGADIVVNGSGWNETANPGEIRGPQIKDGVIYHDFDPWGTGWGEYAIGFR
ncbi:MAG TPA: hypothetical protein VFL73_10545, partial [Solirubrobacteraceae bacterium]|nr:hypothetical protein [Solirubrobacteraceae bacterium]